MASFNRKSSSSTRVVGNVLESLTANLPSYAHVSENIILVTTEVPAIIMRTVLD